MWAWSSKPLLLRSFGTDFLTNAEPEDFLMAGLRDPVVLAFVFLSGLVIAITLGLVFLGRRASTRYSRWKTRTDGLPVMRLVCIEAGFYARHEAKLIRAGEDPAWLTFMQSAAEVESLDGTVDTAS